MYPESDPENVAYPKLFTAKCPFRLSRQVLINENENLEVYPESGPENITYPDLFTVKCPFRLLGITRVQKSTVKSSLWGWMGGWGVHGGPIWPTD